MNEIPARDKQYVMPAEWTPHAATLLIWPHNRDTWPGNRLEAVENIYCAIISALLKYEPAILIVKDESVKQRAQNLLGDYQSLPFPLRIITTPVNDVWARDSGPIIVRNRNGFVITDWEFNSWGGKYAPWDDDNRLPEKISERFTMENCKTGMVLEGGSIDTNGEGLFLTTESVLLNENRNPGWEKEKIEKYLQRYLGAEKIIWLKKGLAGDDTDGHIDDLARFVNKNTVVTAVTDDPASPNYEILKENLRILENSTGRDGKPLHIIQIPLPETLVDDPTVDGSDHVPCSYANFYIANGAVLLPLYDEKTDRQMLDLFSELFPSRTIEGIPCSGLVWGQGSIHCITQQLYGINL
jgi:agmatine deiminase